MNVRRIGDWTLEDRRADGGRPLVVMFLKPEGLKHSQLRAEFRQVADDHPDVRFYEIDLLENPSVARKYSIAKAPIILVFVEGVEAGRHVGSLIASTVDRILGPCHQEGDDA
jgi:hypothetical protein